ncbi:MAG: hypothetical protein KJO90_02965 [Eudoraea sp.]|nr:hypothetical protein [Eudoraea sp.]
MTATSSNTVKYRWLLWLARIWNVLSLAFLLFMLIGHLVGDEDMTFANQTEWLMFLFFPIGIIIGLALCWWKSWLGGLITIGSLLAFRLIGNEIDFNFGIDGTAAPGFLFLLHWTLLKKRS